MFLIVGCSGSSSSDSNVEELTVPGRYTFHIDESFGIPFRGNSCCGNCWTTEKELKFVSFVETLTVKEAEVDCDGCSTNYLKVFRTKNVGIDTIRYYEYAMSDEGCDLYSELASVFIIEVVE